MSSLISRPRLGLAVALACLLALLLFAPTASAQTTTRDWDPDTTKGNAKVKVKVETGPNGVDLQMSVQRTIPRDRDRGRDDDRDEPRARGAPPAAAAPEQPSSSYAAPAGPAPVAGGAAAPAAAAPPWSSPAAAPAVPADAPAAGPRTWTEGATIHEITPEEQHIVLSPVYAPVWSSDGSTLTRQQVRQYPNEGAYTAIVDGQLGNIVWRPLPDPNVAQQNTGPLPADQRPGGGGGLDPLSVALDIEAHIPLPDIRIRTNPGLGLVALPSWYWVEGYRGEHFGESRTITLPPANPNDPNDHGVSYTVEVSVWGDRYDWSFGDGKGTTTRSLGRPYPAESDIQHTYQHSSLPFPNGFPVRLTVEFAAEFRVNGAGPFGLPPIRRTYEAAHRVQEIQPVLITR